jgi:hypothetical protein
MKQVLLTLFSSTSALRQKARILVLDYTIIQDKEDKLVEWCSTMKIKRLKDHKHYSLPMSKIITNHKEGRAKLCKCK